MLTPTEQALFRHLSVFAGGCMPWAAEAAPGPTDGANALDTIGALVDKSLLRMHDTPDGEVRFVMLETLREIADAIAQELDMSGVDAEVRTVEEVPDLESYDAVILGSAMYMGNWESAAQRFVQLHQSRLQTMPEWLFSSGPVGNNDHPGQGDHPESSRLHNSHALGH